MVIRKLTKYVSGLFVILSLTMMLLPFIPGAKSKADDNPASWILCMSSTGSKLYNAATTDSIPYSLRSKSSNVTPTTVDGFMNTILETAGFNFDKVNKKILGRSLYNYDLSSSQTQTDSTSSTKKTKTPNQAAPMVNPFDRFGVEGLTWSSYTGEWKYYQVDACSDSNEVSQTNYGQYYPNRKEPKATYNETANSLDPRVIQFQRGTFSSWITAFNDLLANFLFNIAKFVITLTIALISFSFRDILAVFNVASASGGMSGLFTNFYTGIFQPFVVIMMTFTGIYVFINAIIRKQIRHALINGLGGSIACLFIAMVIAHNPTRWVSMPNQVATYGQALVVDALSGHGQKTKSSLCATNVGGIKANVSPGFGAGAQKAMEKLGENMQSEIGCKMWEVFLLRPFVQGQFGTSYSKLSAGEIKNHNTSWVGKPSVPIGGGKFRNNWALFQISTQTNAHGQLGDDGKYADDPTKNQVSTIDGTARDWYRIVDGLSNYDEKDSGNNVQTGQGGQKELTDQITTLKPSKYWQAWVGNKSTDRYGVAALSIIFAVIGSIAPLLFATLAAIYGVGVSLLMAVSPIFLLFGMWAGPGTEILKGWLSTLLSVLVKKIVAAGLIILSFDLTMACMDLVDKIGWIQSVILLAILSSVMMKSRSKIFDIFANFNFGNAFNPLTPFENMARKTKHVTRDLAVGGASMVIGAHQAKKLGLKRSEGAKIAFNKQVELGLRKSQFGRAALNMNAEYSMDEGQDLFCTVCGIRLTGNNTAWTDEDGNYYCNDCANDMNDQKDLTEIDLPRSIFRPSNTQRSIKERLRKLDKQKLYTPDILRDTPDTLNDLNKVHFNDKKMENQKSWMSYSSFYNQVGLHKTSEGKYDYDHAALIATIQKQLRNLDHDLEEYSKQYATYGNRVQSPAIPEPLKPYLNTIVMNEAWREGQNAEIKTAMEDAWIEYYDDNIRNLGQEDDEQRKTFIDSIKHPPVNPNNPDPDDDPSNNGQNPNGEEPSDDGPQDPPHGGNVQPTRNPNDTNNKDHQQPQPKDDTNTKSTSPQNPTAKKTPDDNAKTSGKSDTNGKTVDKSPNDGKHTDDEDTDKPKNTDSDRTPHNYNYSRVKNPFNKGFH